MEDLPMNESAEGALLGLPESQTELDVSLNRISQFLSSNSEFYFIVYFRTSRSTTLHTIDEFQCWELQTTTCER